MAKREKTSKKRIVLVALGCCCIIAAATLATYNYLDATRAAREAQELADLMASLLAEGTLPADFDLEIDDELAQGGDGDVASRWVGGYDLCGVLSIPKIKVRLAIISEWSYPNLTVSVCRYSGSPEEQMILLGHNYRGHFGDLNKLVAGDKVSFTDVDGVLHEYEVTDSQVFADYEGLDVISGDGWDLTLFTCTYDRTGRVVVRCSRI